MGNKVRDIDTKNRTYYFFDDMINIKSLGLNKIKIDKKPFKNILIYYVGYITFKDLQYTKINTVNPLNKWVF